MLSSDEIDEHLIKRTYLTAGMSSFLKFDVSDLNLCIFIDPWNSLTLKFDVHNAVTAKVLFDI